MKLLSESKALLELDEIRRCFADAIRRGYEHRANDCAACETPGACCLDAHFVNVRISRLEANAITKELGKLPKALREKVYFRNEEAIETYRLHDGSAEKFACPLFEKGTGCLVHDTAKPLPCIAHACYERKEDLPPDELLADREMEIERLNFRVYGTTTFVPIPLAIKQTSPTQFSSNAHQGSTLE